MLRALFEDMTPTEIGSLLVVVGGLIGGGIAYLLQWYLTFRKDRLNEVKEMQALELAERKQDNDLDLAEEVQFESGYKYTILKQDRKLIQLEKRIDDLSKDHIQCLQDRATDRVEMSHMRADIGRLQTKYDTLQVKYENLRKQVKGNSDSSETL